MSQFLQNLESDLIDQYSDVLKLEEDFWKLESRINWLQDGDAFFTLLHYNGLDITVLVR